MTNVYFSLSTICKLLESSTEGIAEAIQEQLGMAMYNRLSQDRVIGLTGYRFKQSIGEGIRDELIA